MAFDAPAAYDRFMGRFSRPLAGPFADAAGVTAGQRVLDVGCGPGALTRELVDRLGPDHVSAVDPSGPFVAAARERLPGGDVSQAGAEDLPYPDDGVDAALAQLVVHFMTDPVAGLREMARVTRPDGTVAACVWDHAGGQGPLSLFWDVVRGLDPGARDESGLPGAARGRLTALFTDAGLVDVRESALEIGADFPDVEDWWQPFTLGVGPAGEYVAGLDDRGRSRLRAACAERLPDGAFRLPAVAWCAVGRVG